MIPSLVVGEIRSALVEYLTSTFALSDDATRNALSDFLADNTEGIFRGPYLRVRTPFRKAEGWTSPLGWLPPGFDPYQHQATAFERLSSFEGRTPQPTIVTTGTGSGKTECFLLPVLDHCARMRAQGKGGIKALLLYPMNALASDQAKRIAELVHSSPQLAGLRAGLYLGDAGRWTDMGPDHLIDKREVLRADPPDILLTNYKMLDFLLLRREDRDLWATNDPDTLAYVVLDEFHTYDGAQGTDVAMLLRRLGQTLAISEPGAPLGKAAPVATSATLGSGSNAAAQLREFAGKVFGTAFPPDSIIGETRTTVEEACLPLDYFLPIPAVNDVLEALDLDDLAEVFCRSTDPDPDEPDTADLGDVVQLGERLLQHPLTRAVLTAVGDRSRSWTDAVAEVVTRAPEWGRMNMTEPAKVKAALGRYLWLLSVARRRTEGRLRPLFSVEVQLWVREVSRVLRSTATAPAFRWLDSGIATDDGNGLPAIYCRHCGMSGWMAVASGLPGRLITTPATVYRASADGAPTVRALLPTHADDPAVQWFDPILRRLSAKPTEGALSVLATADEDGAKKDTCPGCGDRDGIRFLGLRVASLASVSINTLFASEHVPIEERKLLAFTDSVQDASHRASFFAGRTHRINLRSIMAGLLREHGELALDDLGDLLFTQAQSPRDTYALIPPDLERHRAVRTVWSDAPHPYGAELLRQRLAFEAHVEFGLRARVGRTIELSGAAGAEVHVPELDEVIDLLAEDLVARHGAVDPEVVARLPEYVRGVVERLRLRGGIQHPFLIPYLADNGRQWLVWGGRPDGLPPFTPGQGRPLFFTTSSGDRTDFDSLAVAGTTPSWLVDWSGRVLGLDRNAARDLNLRTLALLARHTDVVTETVTNTKASVYGIAPSSIRVFDAVDGLSPTAVRCATCGNRHPAPQQLLDQWYGTPCLRYRCSGTFELEPPRATNYYRRLYREGRTTRVVTGEHTGLLDRKSREDLERAFMSGTEPDAPNVLTATPTLEMGIDIGDLSAVMLTSVPRRPANYIQRVGRAGRSTGNALVATFVPTDSHGLYYLADPEAMIAGEVRPPNCYLDAVETLQRQYFAYLLDRVADGTLADAPPLSRDINGLMSGGLDAGGLLRVIVDASMLDPTLVQGFLATFGTQLHNDTIAELREYAATGIERRVKATVDEWRAQRDDLLRRRDRLNDALNKERASHDDPEIIASLLGQRSVVVRLLQRHRSEYTLSELERLGLLPNYTLVDQTSKLDATLWSKDDAGNYETELFQYQRPAALALTEFAPGNSFYARGHRHLIDALEVGPADQPHYEDWRLCPACGFGNPETPGVPITVCPRCSERLIGDTGARHAMLRLTTAFSSSSEEAARVYDEDDDRRRERFDTVVTVDVVPETVEGAWELIDSSDPSRDRAFGAELAGIAHIRRLNLGYRERRGETMPIGGAECHVTRFNVCRHCGSVLEARDDNGGRNPERQHQGWCKVRSGAERQAWRPVVLYHELSTEAVRLLLPVSMFEVESRLANFKAALLLGLRSEFGGDPDHLEIITSTMPNRAGQGQRRFLVLYDRIPGGTGYLAGLAAPEKIQSLLLAAQEAISRCTCATEGRSACHRCLLGVVDRNEYDFVRRDLALELLQELLEGWVTRPVDSVASIDIGRVEESELERRFKVALQEWAGEASNNATLKPLPKHQGFDSFELTLKDGDDVVRWRINEQEGLGTRPSTIPDFVFHRLDGSSPDVAIYLDGYQYHASLDCNYIAADAQKRAGIRADGKLVWNLSWEDVTAFHKAVAADPPKRAAGIPLLSGQALAVAQRVQHQRGGRLDADVTATNAVDQLLEFVRRPNSDDWERLAVSFTAALASAGSQHRIGSAELAAVLGSFGCGDEPTWGPDTTTPQYLAGAHTTANGLTLGVVLDLAMPNEERWTAIASLHDDASSIADPLHPPRWREWLRWANLLQFMRGVGRDAVLTATSLSSTLDTQDLWLSTPPTGPRIATGDEMRPLDRSVLDELDLIEDRSCRTLVEGAVQRTGLGPKVGHELPDGTPIEAAWPKQRVGVALDHIPAAEGWTIRTVAEWDEDDLVNLLLKET